MQPGSQCPSGSRCPRWCPRREGLLPPVAPRARPSRTLLVLGDAIDLQAKGLRRRRGGGGPGGQGWERRGEGVVCCLLVAVGGLEVALVNQELAAHALWSFGISCVQVGVGQAEGRRSSWGWGRASQTSGSGLLGWSRGATGPGRAPRGRPAVCVWGCVGSSVHIPKGVLRKVVPGGCLALGTVVGGYRGQGSAGGRVPVREGGTVPLGPSADWARLTRRPQCWKDCGSGQRLLP